MSLASSKSMQIQFQTVDGIPIRYAESDGHPDQPILLTNPWPESLYAFLPMWQSLAAHAHLVAIDLPGFGQSGRRVDLFSPQAMGEFLIRLIEEGGLQTPHTLGPDVGTAAALFAAGRRPEKRPHRTTGSSATADPL